MLPHDHTLKNGQLLLIREAEPEDARSVLDYVESVSGESDYLSFGPGEFDLTEAQEETYLRDCRDADNQLYILGLVEDRIVAALSFSGGHRPRLRHSGEFGMSVRKEFWGLGIGSLMLDTLIDWAKGTGVVKKVNLRVRTDNVRAIALYEGRGFTTEGTTRRDVCVNGVYFDHHCMGLDV